MVAASARVFDRRVDEADPRGGAIPSPAEDSLAKPEGSGACPNQTLGEAPKLQALRLTPGARIEVNAYDD